MKNYRISAKFVDEALIPARALDCDFKGDNQNAVFITNDGIQVRLEFKCSMNNKDSRFEVDLESYCTRRYNMHFSRYEEMWREKFNYLDDYWHIVEMFRI